MSHQAVNWAIEQRTGGPSPKATLWSIANYANEAWCSWPSQKTIGDESEQSPDTVQRRVRDLEESGFIRRIPLHFAGRRSVDFFILKPSPYFEATLEEIDPLLPRGYSVAPQHAAASCGSAVSDKTPTEPDVSGPDAAATATATAAALLRQQEPLNLDGGGKSARAREALVKPDAFALTERIAAIAGFPDPKAWPPGWCGAPMRVQAMLDRGWQADLMIATAQSVMARKIDGPPESVGYFEKPFARAHAQNNKPFPTAVEGSSNHHAQSRKGGFADALARLKSTIEGRERFGDGVPEGGPGAVRLVTDGRSQ